MFRAPTCPHAGKYIARLLEESATNRARRLVQRHQRGGEKEMENEKTGDEDGNEDPGRKRSRTRSSNNSRGGGGGGGGGGRNKSRGSEKKNKSMLRSPASILLGSANGSEVVLSLIWSYFSLRELVLKVGVAGACFYVCFFVSLDFVTYAN